MWPKWIPQLADATEVLAKIKRKAGVSYPVLVPNRKGLDGAIAEGRKEIVTFGAVFEDVARHIPNEKLAGHFHDTYGQALTNTYAALECRVATFDSSVAGLGGCPYAKGATGNVATEDMLFMLQGLGIETGVDMAKLMEAGRYICDYLKCPTGSRVAKALMA